MKSLTQMTDEELSRLFAVCHEVVEHMLSFPGNTYPVLSRIISVSESTLKQFIGRGRSPGQAIAKRGHAFLKIGEFVVDKFADLPPSA